MPEIYIDTVNGSSRSSNLLAAGIFELRVPVPSAIYSLYQFIYFWCCTDIIKTSQANGPSQIGSTCYLFMYIGTVIWIESADEVTLLGSQ